MAERGSTQPSEVDVLRWQSKKAWDWFEETLSDVNAEQANWWPTGTTNSIGATYLHVVINNDVEINRLIERREPSWSDGGMGTWGRDLPMSQIASISGFGMLRSTGTGSGKTGERCARRSSSHWTSSPTSSST